MAAIEQSRLSRRTMLTGAAALLAAGAVGVPAGARSARPAVRAAAARGRGLVAVTEDYALRELHVVGGRVVPGPPLEIALPEDFHPHSIAALGESLLVTGAAEPGPDRALPAAVRVDGDRARYVDLPVPGQIRSGIATAVIALESGEVAVAVEGCPDAHAPIISRTHLAFSGDGGATWDHRLLASGYGEGYGTVMTAVDGEVFAVVGAESAQKVHTGPDLEAVATLPGAGRPMGAVAAGGLVSVVSERGDHEIRETRFTGAGKPLEATAACDCDGEFIAVAGGGGAWLDSGPNRISYRKYPIGLIEE